MANAKQSLRILTAIGAFKPGASSSVLCELPAGLISSDEEILGVYENVAEALRNAVVVTDKAFYVECEGEFKRTPYSEIKSMAFAPEKKREAESVVVTLNDRTTRMIPIRGREDRGADVFEFMRFILHVKPKS